MPKEEGSHWESEGRRGLGSQWHAKPQGKWPAGTDLARERRRRRQAAKRQNQRWEVKIQVCSPVWVFILSLVQGIWRWGVRSFRGVLLPSPHLQTTEGALHASENGNMVAEAFLPQPPSFQDHSMGDDCSIMNACLALDACSLEEMHADLDVEFWHRWKKSAEGRCSQWKMTLLLSSMQTWMHKGFTGAGSLPELDNARK